MLHDVHDVEVRSAVGETVGLVVHCCGLGELCVREANGGGSYDEGGESEGECEGEFDGEGEREEGNGLQEDRESGLQGDGENVSHEQGSTEQGGANSADGLGGIVGRMRELACAGKKRTDDLRHSRRDKAEMRAAFRSVLEVVEQSQVRVCVCVCVF